MLFISLLFESVWYEGLVALNNSFVPSVDPRSLPADFSTPVSITSHTASIHCPISFGVLDICVPTVLPHFIKVFAPTSQAFKPIKFASHSTPTPVFCRFLFCSGDCDSYHALIDSIAGATDLEIDSRVLGSISFIPAWIPCHKTPVIGDRADCTAHTPHLAAASGNVYCPLAKPSHAAPILDIPHLKPSAILLPAHEMNPSGSCFGASSGGSWAITCIISSSVAP